MKTKDFTSWKSSDLAIEKAIEFIEKNYVIKNADNISELDEIFTDLKRALVYIADATALDMRNASGNFLREFNETYTKELKEEFKTKY